VGILQQVFPVLPFPDALPTVWLCKFLHDLLHHGYKPAYFLLQGMYCSEECRDSDWNSGHKDSCVFTCDNYAGYFNSGQCGAPGRMDPKIPLNFILHRLFGLLGFSRLRSAVLQNEPVESLSDPRTKGFADGKFDTPNLQALLSLEDNVHKLSDREAIDCCLVSNYCIIIIIALFSFMKHQRIQYHLSRSAHLQMSQIQKHIYKFLI